MECYVYMLECCDGSFYSGWTVDLGRRLASHRKGLGSRYTRSRLPVRMVFFEAHDSKSSAMSRECALKKLNRRQKEALINRFNPHLKESNGFMP